MSQFAKAQIQLQKGDAKYDEALVVSGTAVEKLNNLVSAPSAIKILGLLMKVTAARDFDLVLQDNMDMFQQLPNRELVPFPQSMRATMCHLANQGYNAFNAAHGDMQVLSSTLSVIPQHMTNCVKFLLDKEMTTPHMLKYVKTELRHVEKHADTCFELATESFQRFERVEDMLQLIEELCHMREKRHSEQADAVQKQRKLLEIRKQHEADVKKTLEAAMKDAEKQLKENTDAFRKQMDAAPGISTMALAGVADACTGLVQGLKDSVSAVVHPFGPSASRFAASKSSGAPSADQPDQAAAQHRHQMHMKQISVKREFFSNWHRHPVSTCDAQTDAQRLKKADLPALSTKFHRVADQASKCGLPEVAIVAEQIKDLTKELSDVLKSGQENFEEKNDIIAKFDIPRQKIEELEIYENFDSKTPPMGPAPVFTPPPAEQSISRGVQRQWILKAAAAEKQLEHSQVRMDHAREQYNALLEKNSQTFEKLNALDLEKLSLQEIKGVLELALKQVVECKKVWASIRNYFKEVHATVKFLAETQISVFVSLINDTTDAKVTDNFDPTSQVKQLMYQACVDSQGSVYTAKYLADVYVDVSEKYFVPSLIGLSGILTMTPGSREMIETMGKYEAQCNAAQEELKGHIEGLGVDLRKIIDDRKAQISSVLLPLLDATPELRQEVNCQVQLIAQKAIENAPTPLDEYSAEDLC